ncbi:hypothetical protein M3181_22130 [Mesobacillus maritimus]|uniref:hypothetical protein n=1 Tax=Mesobacillus maritimus TaxID=1643336 RepID=UPI00203ADB5F|nr:hypothetical protein [Mesobacillus maritimus]MCM3671658.1 hypothetical protein [Mesobacillus maritimus]
MGYHQDLLILLSKKGYQAAKVKLGQSKQELILSLAIEYLGEGLSFMDLINNANIGLMKGINELENDNENDIDDFLSPFIKESIQQAISNI